MLTSTPMQDLKITHFLSRIALFGGLAELALLGMMMMVVMPAGQDANLPFDFVELIAATKVPGLFRLTMVLDASVWLAIGGFLVAFAILFSRKLPAFSVVIAASGVIALVSGFAGAFIRLEGTLHLAASYLAASESGHAAILQSFLDLQSTINAHFDAGSWIYAIAYLIVASLIWKQADFPRWIAIPLTLAAVFTLTGNLMTLILGESQFVVFFLALLSETTALLSIATVFWKRIE